MKDVKNKSTRLNCGRSRMNDLIYDFWWASLSGSYPGPMCRIAMEAGSAGKLYEMDKKGLIRLKGVSERFADLIISHRESFDPEKEFEACVRKGIDFIPHYSSRFPERLRRINGSPFAVFVKGSLPSDDKRSVAVIGARECSEYGKRVAADIGKFMAENRVQVVSGMAYGIDGIAQDSCLNAGGQSFGVLGSGVDICYPASNRSLYDRLCMQGGVISEYAPGTPPKANHFPPRNRIISALSDVIVVVEARLRSGTSITVDMALEQGKDVLVVPGRIYDTLSTGCIHMWKQGAIPVSCPEDILEAIDSSYALCSGGISRDEGADVRLYDETGEKDSGKKSSDAGSGDSYRTNGTGRRQGGEAADGLFAGSGAQGSHVKTKEQLSENEKKLFDVLDVYAKSAGRLSEEAGLEIFDFMSAVMRLEMLGLAKEMGRDHYIKVLAR
ncbi:MAG: DNA-processing protein DprA [Lachnospiraceae bacterium]|nr:DNA-processing protein DprA [Lachnospiraceae bacterium]